ncbi:MAG: hypothetical protein A2103_05495 [Gammaproteobacteria bacterium GWF2_41_13]|nr:MAG: hypothetical protein A2103_05495 [Gammaproteobacteria bacterium GWF2_41_13]
MKKIILMMCLLVGFVGIANSIYAAPMKCKMQCSRCSKPQIEFGKAMRVLWEDHIIYTRNYIISALADLPDADAVAKRLLKNQDDIGNAIKPYYGNDAGTKLSVLLCEHIMIAADVVKAAKMNDSKSLKSAQEKWQDNAMEIAVFLSSANPNWSKDDLQQMLLMHLDLTTGEVTARLQKDWNSDIDFFDKGQAHMLKFADVLSEGIIKQFPDKFMRA